MTRIRRGVRLAAASAAALCLLGTAAFADARPQKVVICLDGIPISIIEELRAEGHFSRFRAPAPLVSTFPAITEIMLTEMFRTEKPPGYGLRYYDRDSNVLRGGLGSAEAISIWFSLYDYVTPMFDRGVVYLYPGWARVDIDKTRCVLDECDTEVLLLHLDSTDAITHNRKPAVVIAWLKRFDAMIAEMMDRRDSEGRPLRLLVFSDHGNDLTPCRRVEIERELKRAGYKVGSVIKGETGVAILPTGLISVSYLYTRDEVNVARVAARTEGVDMALHELDGKVHVVSKRGAATIERRGDLFSYSTVDGDPLELDSAVAAMASAGLLDSDGFASDTAWFEHTLRGRYPDALKNAWDALHGHVEHVADVFLSLEKGWHCGSKFLDLLVNFQGTHGSLERESVTGFVMTDFMELKPCRAEQLLDEVGWRAAVAENARSKGVELRYTDGSEHIDGRE